MSYRMSSEYVNVRENSSLTRVISNTMDMAQKCQSQVYMRIKIIIPSYTSVIVHKIANIKTDIKTLLNILIRVIDKCIRNCQINRHLKPIWTLNTRCKC
jgi:hypothetical protein